MSPARITLLIPRDRSRPFAVVLAGGNPTRLRSPDGLFFTFQQTATFGRAIGHQTRYVVETTRYSYVFATDVSEENPRGRELMTFHWTPESVNRGEKRFAHLHIKSPMLARPLPVASRTFSSAHIPTEPLRIERIVRFAFEELQVVPLTDNWEEILARADSVV